MHKSIDCRKLLSICFYDNMEKNMNGIGFTFPRESARVTSDITCTLIGNSYEPISAWEF